ncbi:hypothetical protein PMKS-003749 [Pichia membranifaciens]|uniref:Uncharacterized protein n=1 Tax=Pichia membranifaciens TaxID=4926 RepID=A0A1Q2YL38_9ASCO|nr:hypothetical protein PMKS-003749 [Pichia membranifaciens]
MYHRAALDLKYLKSLLITTSHIYSLTTAIWLMAHGLNHLPKAFWLTSYSKKLHLDYIKLPELRIHLEDSKFELRDVCNKINSLHEILDLNPSLNTELDVSLRDHILYLHAKIPEEFKFDRNLRSSNNNYQFLMDSIGVSTNEINDVFLSKLNEDLKRRVWDYEHSKSIFEHKVLDIVYLEDVINYLNNSSFNTSFDNANTGLEIEWRSHKICWPRWTFVYIWPLLYKLVAVGFALIGLIIIESEMMHGTRLSVMGWIIQNTSTLSCFKMVFILIIMMSCALLSLGMVKLFNIYKVEFNSNSDPVSSVYFISYALRLTIPLGYNFLTLLDTSVTSNSAFLKFVSGNLKLISFGEFLNDIIPRLILVPVLMSFFGVWGKLRRWLDGYFLFDYLLDEMYFPDDITERSTDLRSNNDLESAVGSTNKTAALLQEGRTISQRYVSNGNLQLNDSLPRVSPLPSSMSNSHLSRNALGIVTFPFRLVKAGAESVGGLFGRLFGRGMDIEGSDSNIDGLRAYNIPSASGFVLESRRNSQASEQSRLSGVSGLSGESGTEYDADNRVLGDEYISSIH